MRQSACLVFGPVMVDNYAAFFNCTLVGRAPDSLMAPVKRYSFLVGWDRTFLSGASTGVFLLLWSFSKLFDARGSPSPGSLLIL